MELIDKVKQVISGYYSGDLEKLYIPEDIVGEVFDIAASNVENIEQFCIFHDQLSEDILFQCTIRHSVAKAYSIRQFIAFYYIKQIQQNASLIESIPSDITKSIAVLSNLDLETMPNPFPFVMFDKKIAIVLEADANGGYFLTTNHTILQECADWLRVPVIDEESVKSAFFLQEPLMFSADMLSEAALVLCTHDHMNHDSCYWYHSVWQYLRLMNMVSTPSWHHSFYITQLAKAIRHVDCPSVLISGAADYSSLSYVIHVVKSLGKDGIYSVLDMCDTPLFACKWFAKNEKVDVETIRSSIFELSASECYNLICTDAFLTRFSKEDMLRVVSIWNNALVLGGNVVTTVRIHDEAHACPETPSEEDIALFKHRAYERSKVWGNMINYSQKQVSEMAEVYARQMKSNDIGDKESILEAFQKSGFKIAYLEDAEVQGELYPSRYLRIRAVKGE